MLRTKYHRWICEQTSDFSFLGFQKNTTSRKCCSQKEFPCYFPLQGLEQQEGSKLILFESWGLLWHLVHGGCSMSVCSMNRTLSSQWTDVFSTRKSSILLCQRLLSVHQILRPSLQSTQLGPTSQTVVVCAWGCVSVQADSAKIKSYTCLC